MSRSVTSKIEHYKAARNHLGVKLAEAKKIVDRLYKEVEMEPSHEADFTGDYERAWNEIQNERREAKKRRERERRDKWARNQSTMVILHRSDGSQDVCILEKPLADVVLDAGQAWADDPTFAYEEYTFGNISGAAILEIHHQLLDGKPIEWAEPEDIEYLKLRPVDV